MKISRLQEIIREEIFNLIEQDDSWWTKMSPDQQKDYIKRHPQSQKAQDAKKEKDRFFKKLENITKASNFEVPRPSRVTWLQNVRSRASPEPFDEFLPCNRKPVFFKPRGPQKTPE